MNLKHRTLRAGIWSSLNGLAGVVLRFGSSLAMTRLLFPEAFGVYGVAVTVMVIIYLLSDIGLKQFVVFRPHGNEQRYLDTIWSLSVIQGVLVAVVAAAVGVLVGVWQASGAAIPGSVYAQPELPLLIVLTAASSIISGFKSPKFALLDRNLDLRRSTIISFLSQLTGVIVTIALAWAWRDVWSIVGGAWCTAAVSMLLSIFWLDGPIGRLRWDKAVAREVFFYGRWILLSSAAYVVAGNLDKLLLGVWVTPALLGIYMIALSITGLVDGVISKPFSDVAMPAFSEVIRRGEGGLREAYFKLRLPMDLVTLAAAGFFFAAAPLIIEILYDSRYAEAGRTLQIMSCSLMFVRYGATNAVHLSLGESRTASISSVIKLISVAVAIPIGHALGGYFGAVWAIALHMIPSVLYLTIKNQKHGLNNLAFEAKVLLVWPVGFAGGMLFNLVAKPIVIALGLK